MTNFRIAALISASVLLASCGGGGGGGPGNNSISTNYEPEPRPPEIGTLTATDSGDGEQTEENEEQQQIIVVNQEEEDNQEEQQQITVNVQSEPEEESEEEENNNEEAPQQLTIIEEPEPTYIPPAKQEPRYSASTASLGSSTGNKFTGFPTVGGSSTLDSITATYHKRDGFVGDYVYKGVPGKFSSDVKLIFTLDETNARIRGYLGNDIGFYDGSGSRSSSSNYYMFYGLLVDATVDTKTGSFTVTDPEFGIYLWDNLDSRPSRVNRTDSGTGTIEATFSNGGSNDDLPSTITGKVEVTGFLRKNPTTTANTRTSNGKDYVKSDGSYHRSANSSLPNGFTSNHLVKSGKKFVTGPEWPSGENNSLTGTFSSDLVSDVKVRKLEGNIGPFSYGVWANDNFLDNRIVFLGQTTKFNPKRTASDYTPHQNNNADVRYERENGFKGIYIYEGNFGELTGDVELKLQFSSNSISVSGNISSDLEIEGNDLDGIILTFADIDSTTGVGSYTSGEVNAVAFGNADLSSQTFDLKTVHDIGQAKLRMVLSPDGVPAQGSTPESYPSQIAGELEINGFKIKTGDGDNNTVVGVFVGDKQE